MKIVKFKISSRGRMDLGRKSTRKNIIRVRMKKGRKRRRRVSRGLMNGISLQEGFFREVKSKKRKVGREMENMKSLKESMGNRRKVFFWREKNSLLNGMVDLRGTEIQKITLKMVES